MGTIFTLTSDIRTVSKTLLDDMLNELGKTLRLVYEPVKSLCPNCRLSPITKRSSGVYESGGPIPFEGGQPCPVCEGEGWLVSEEKFDDIKASVARSPRDWFIAVSPDIVVPAGTVQLKMFSSNWAKAKRARKVILSPESGGVELETYKLHSALGDPSNLVPGRYMVGLFERV